MQRVGLIIVSFAITTSVFAGDGRYEISQAKIPMTISTEGSYVLTESIVGIPGNEGISVDAGNVTIDLNGHVMRGVAGSSHGILLSASISNVVVRNGIITGWGGSGVAGINTSHVECRKLRLVSNGNRGIDLGLNAIIADCYATSNGGPGIQVSADAHVSGCSAINNSFHGIWTAGRSVVIDCLASFNENVGIFSSTHGLVSRCVATWNGAQGYIIATGSTMGDCTAHENGGHGVQATGDVTLKGVTSTDNGSKGIWVNGSATITDCLAVDNSSDGISAQEGATIRGCAANENGGHGVSVDTGSLVIECTAFNNATNGVVVASGSTVKDCTARVNDEHGIYTFSNCRIVGNMADQNGDGAGITNGAGVYVNGEECYVEGNVSSDNDIGYVFIDNDNIVVRNAALGNNVSNFVFAVSGNEHGVVEDEPGANFTADPWSNISTSD